MGYKECYKLGYTFGGLTGVFMIPYYLAQKSLMDNQLESLISTYENIKDISLTGAIVSFGIASFFAVRGLSLEGKLDK